mgnify:CR=1 FL=1
MQFTNDLSKRECREGVTRRFEELTPNFATRHGSTHENACDFVKNCVSIAFNIPLRKLNAPTRLGARIAFARQVAMYIAHVQLGLKLHEVGRYFDRDRTTVAHACRLVEDHRDNSEIDFLIDCLCRSLDEWRALSSASSGRGGSEER